MSLGGRPTELTPELIAKAAAFVDRSFKQYISPATIAIQVAADKYAYGEDGKPRKKPEHVLPTVERLALYLNISRSTLYQWAEDNQDFAWVVDRLRLKKSDQLQQGGITGAYNPSITNLLLKNEGYTDKSEVESNVNGNVTVEVVNYADEQNQSTS